MFLDKFKNFLNLNSESPYFLTIDFGSDYLKVLLNERVVEENEEKVRIRFSYSEFIGDFTDESGEIRDLYSLKTSLGKIISKIHDDMPNIHFSEAAVVISSSNSRQIMTTLLINRVEDVPISEKENSEITQKILEEAYSEISNVIYEETLEENPALEVIDLLPVYLRSNGDDVIDLIGEEGSEVQVCYSVIFAKSQFIESIKKLLSGYGLVPTFISSNLAVLKSLKGNKKTKTDCIIMDIGSKTTEVAVCFGGGILLNKFVNIGGASLTSELSKKLNLSYQNAEKVKKFYTQNKLKEKEAAVVQKIILFNLEHWLKGLEEIFGDFTSVKTFPSDFYVIGGSSELPDITELLFEEPWTKSIPFKSLPEFKRIDFSTLKKLNKSQMARPNEDLIPILTSIEYLKKRKI